MILDSYKKQTNSGTRYNQHVNLLLGSWLLLEAELCIIMRCCLQVHIYDLLNVFFQSSGTSLVINVY